ncbi:MAG: MBL fold metallo-hydrolase [Methanomicrobiales archaeon]|nr:MBL fold metallo-hydrolase [Methanomicrobiales archaeon]
MPITWLPGGGALANSYRDGSVLIDTGVSPMAIKPFAEEIMFIVCTHCHFDHTAHLAEIAHLTGAGVCIHAADAPGLIEDRFSLAHHFGARSPAVPVSRLLEEGDEIGPYRVLHTPGHTPGSICLWDPEEAVLISGDTVFSDGDFGRYDFPGGSREELARSLARIATIPVEGLYPGHGFPVEQGGRRHIAAALNLIGTWNG